MEKVFFELDENWHGHSTESVWAEKVTDNRFIIKNVPFYAKGIGYDDLVNTVIKEGKNVFKSVYEGGGHSTYRIILSDTASFNEFWQPLEKIGCTYEKGEGNLYAIDVPPKTDIYKVYSLLQIGEDSNAWSFEEGQCGHTVQKPN
jgi:hypothetical protein